MAATYLTPRKKQEVLDFFFVVAARVVSGRRHESPILYERVEEVVRAVHKGFLKFRSWIAD